MLSMSICMTISAKTAQNSLTLHLCSSDNHSKSFIFPEWFLFLPLKKWHHPRAPSLLTLLIETVLWFQSHLTMRNHSNIFIFSASVLFSYIATQSFVKTNLWLVLLMLLFSYSFRSRWILSIHHRAELHTALGDKACTLYHTRWSNIYALLLVEQLFCKGGLSTPLVVTQSQPHNANTKKTGTQNKTYNFRDTMCNSERPAIRGVTKDIKAITHLNLADTPNSPILKHTLTQTHTHTHTHTHKLTE